MNAPAIHDLPTITPADLALPALRAAMRLRDDNARLAAENVRLRGELLAKTIEAAALRCQLRRDREQAGAAADLAASQAGAS